MNYLPWFQPPPAIAAPVRHQHPRTGRPRKNVDMTHYRAMRKEGMTQAQCAVALGVSRRTITERECGK